MECMLLIDKPQGWTSFDVVNYVRKIVATSIGKKPRSIKVGHTGTLDPAASGLLVLCVGKTYTKRVPMLIKHDKTYEAEITLGQSSSTGDRDGDITIDEEPHHKPVKDEVTRVLASFVGQQKQTPPQYSAVKVNGKRAYALARAGKEAAIKPRDIVVHDIYLHTYEWPKITLTCHVGSGTYIRVLAEDIARELGTTGYLSALRRTVVDAWTIDQALEIDSLTPETIRNNLIKLSSPSRHQ